MWYVGFIRSLHLVWVEEKLFVLFVVVSLFLAIWNVAFTVCSVFFSFYPGFMLLYIAIDGRFLQAVESALPHSPFICLLPAIWSLKSHWLASLCRRSPILGYFLDCSLRLWWSLQGSYSSCLIHWQGYTCSSTATEWAPVCCVRMMTNLSLSSMCHTGVFSIQVVKICPGDNYRGNKDSYRGGYEGLIVEW